LLCFALLCFVVLVLLLVSRPVFPAPDTLGAVPLETAYNTATKLNQLIVSVRRHFSGCGEVSD
jgi:hypothetical protein